LDDAGFLVFFAGVIVALLILLIRSLQKSGENPSSSRVTYFSLRPLNLLPADANIHVKTITEPTSISPKTTANQMNLDGKPPVPPKQEI